MRTPFEDRHLAAREALMTSQRGRIIEAFVEAVAEKGYAATTLSDIVGRARISRTTFYEHFQDKEQCLLAAVDEGLAFVLSRVQTERERIDPDDWRALLENMIRTYCDTVVVEPLFARVLLIETLRAGEAAAQRREAAAIAFIAPYRAAYERARMEQADLPPLSDVLLELLVDGIAEHTRRLLANDQTAHISERAADMIDFAYRVLGI